ncbi:hypothetical protein [Aeromonas bivalvium]|uniref:hypothetical protein n=1 Tax=Aeromonas bivalvium TaxID=440079 RepID=UPI0038D1BF5B
MNYYAWAQDGHEPRFVGPTNPRTGKRSQAGALSVFNSRQQREAFINQTHGAAVAVTAKQARERKAGLDERAFNELVNVLTGGEA